MKTCIYLRKSREDDDKETIEETLMRHKTTLLAYAQEYKLDVLSVKEEVVSGESLAKRPQMIELLDEIEDDKYEAVLVMDFDRLCRGEMLDQGIIISTLKRHDVKIMTLDKVYDLSDELDEDMIEFSAFFARKELKTIKKRLQRGRMKSLEEGNYIGGHSPYGYKYNKATKKLEIHPEESKHVLMIFDMYINQDMGDCKIANYMNDLGVKTKLGRTWDKTTVRKIITNPVYTGKIRWGTYTKNPKLFDGNHEPLISFEDFTLAQELTKTRFIPRVRDSYAVRNPIARLIRCSGCGRTMMLRTCKRQPDSLRCPNNCGNMGSYVEPVEKRLVDLAYTQLNQVLYDYEYRRKKENKKTEVKSIKSMIINKEKEIDKMTDQKNKLYDLLEQGIYDNATFLDRMNLITNKITESKSELDNIKQKLIDLSYLDEEATNRIPAINSAIDFIDNIYWNASAQDKNKFLHSIIDYALYTKSEKGLDLFQLDISFKI